MFDKEVDNKDSDEVEVKVRAVLVQHRWKSMLYGDRSRASTRAKENRKVVANLRKAKANRRVKEIRKGTRKEQRKVTKDIKVRKAKEKARVKEATTYASTVVDPDIKPKTAGLHEGRTMVIDKWLQLFTSTSIHGMAATIGQAGQALGKILRVGTKQLGIKLPRINGGMTIKAINITNIQQVPRRPVLLHHRQHRLQQVLNHMLQTQSKW